MLRIALAQINTTVGDISGNQKKIIEYIHKAQAQNADIVAFPELAITGYPPEDLLYKEYFIRDNLKALQALVKHVRGIAVVVGFVNVDKYKRLFNAASVITQGRIKGIFHKKDLPNYGVFDEKRYFKEGDIRNVYSIRKLTVGINICEDIWKKEGIHKWEAQAGSDVLINISSSPYDLEKLERRKKLLIGRAREDKAFICYANLVGGQDELVFDGGSMVVDPHGEIIAMGKQFEEDLVVVDLEIKKPKSRRTKKIIALTASAKTKKDLPKPSNL